MNQISFFSKKQSIQIPFWVLLKETFSIPTPFAWPKYGMHYIIFLGKLGSDKTFFLVKSMEGLYSCKSTR
jgi:hypothetical protein